MKFISYSLVTPWFLVSTTLHQWLTSEKFEASDKIFIFSGDKPFDYVSASINLPKITSLS
jgi:hypothetical protein